MSDVGAANDQQQYVDDREFAKRTPISRVGWQPMRSKGVRPNYYKVGRRCLYRWTELFDWLEAHRTTTKAG